MRAGAGPPGAVFCQRRVAVVKKVRREIEHQARGERRCGPGFDRFDLDHPPLERIIQAFQRYRDRVAIFHYGGHANGYQLLLESAAGGSVAADSASFAAFLAEQSGLQLVFLNAA